MKKLFSKIALVAMSTFALMACDEADDAGKKYGFEYDADNLTITFDAEPTVNTESFTFTSYMDWSVELVAADTDDDLEWVSVDPKKGKAGESTITIKMENNNTSDNMRTCYAVVTAGTYEVKVSVNQRGINNDGGNQPSEVWNVSAIEIMFSSDFEYTCEINYGDNNDICFMGFAGEDKQFEVAYDDNGSFEMSDDHIYDMMVGSLYCKFGDDNKKVVRFLSRQEWNYFIGTITYDGDYIDEVVIDNYDNDSYQDKTFSTKYECTWSNGNLIKVEALGVDYASSTTTYTSDGYAEFTYSNDLMNTNIDLNEIIMFELSNCRGGEFYQKLLPLFSMGYLGESSKYLLSKVIEFTTSTDGLHEGTPMTIEIEEEEDGQISSITTQDGNGTTATYIISYVEDLQRME